LPWLLLVVVVVVVVVAVAVVVVMGYFWFDPHFRRAAKLSRSIPVELDPSVDSCRRYETKNVGTKERGTAWIVARQTQRRHARTHL